MKTPILDGICQSDLDLNGFALLGIGEGSVPGGLDTQLQVNSSGTLAGIPEVTYDGALPLKVTTNAATNVNISGLELQNTGATGNRISPEIHLIRYGNGQDGVGKYDTKIWGEGGFTIIATQFNDGGYFSNHGGWHHTGISIDPLGTISNYSGDAQIILAAIWGLDTVATGGDASHPSRVGMSNDSYPNGNPVINMATNGLITWDPIGFGAREGDTILRRPVAGVMQLQNVLQLTPLAVSALPAATLGRIAVVNDGAASLAWGAIVTGGGSTKYLVWHNGTNWVVVGSDATTSTPVYIGTDARLTPITGGAKLQVRNPGTGTWADADQWTNP